MTQLGIVTGLVFEGALLTAALGKTNPNGILVGCAGLGREAACKAAQDLIARGATALMSFGIAGGLDPALESGAAVVASEVRNEVTALVCDAAWSVRIYEALVNAPCRSPAGEKTLKAPLAHASGVLSHAGDKAALFAATGAAVADMESYGVAEVAAAHKVPFAALRVVADGAGDAVPAVALAATTEDGRVRVGKSILRALANPWQIPGLIRLGRRTAVATRRLEALANFGVARRFFADL